MKSVLQEAVEAADELLNALPPCEPGSHNHERQKRLRDAVERIRGCNQLSGSVYLDLQSLTKRANGRDWYLSLDPSGKLIAIFRQRGILDMVDAGAFRPAL